MRKIALSTFEHVGTFLYVWVEKGVLKHSPRSQKCIPRLEMYRRWVSSLSTVSETSNFDPSNVACFYRIYFAELYIIFFQWKHIQHHIAALDATFSNFFKLARICMTSPCIYCLRVQNNYDVLRECVEEASICYSKQSKCGFCVNRYLVNPKVFLGSKTSLLLKFWSLIDLNVSKV